MTVFDEATGLAVRKYFFFVDEKAHHIPFLEPKWTTQFNGQLIIDKAVLEKPYASQNARSIAIIKEIQKQFADDIAKVSGDNKNIAMCQMVVNESFEQLQLFICRIARVGFKTRHAGGCDVRSSHLRQRHSAPSRG